MEGKSSRSDRSDGRDGEIVGQVNAVELRTGGSHLIIEDRNAGR